MKNGVILDPYVEAVFQSKERLRREDAKRPYLEKLAIALSLGEFVEEMAKARTEKRLFGTKTKST
jgi:hypothetical protein